MSSTDPEFGDLPQRKQIQVRLTPTELAELDKLRDELATLPAYDALSVTRSTVMRLAIARGVEVLRDEIAAVKPKKRRK